MKNLKILGIVAMLALFGIGLMGCSESTNIGATDPVVADNYDDMDMNKDFGGLTYTDEAEDFGDVYYAQAALEDLDAETEDPMQQDVEVLAYEAELLDEDPADPVRPRPEITVLRLTWGQLEGLIEDIDETNELMDWSGMVRVDRGIAVARRLILFEKPRDHVVRPRIDRHTVAFVSHTGPHYDGLIIEIIEPPLDPEADTDPAPNMLHIVTPQVTLDINVDELAGMDRTVDVDDLGNAMRLEGFHLSDLDLCPKGFLGGIWIAQNETTDDGTVIVGGFYKGRWVDVWGRLMGAVRGRYGIDDDGNRVFFGKYINRSGHIRGLIDGTWEPDVDGGRGTFTGEWINRAETVEGVLGGQYIQAAERPGGFFSGRYAGLCDEDAESIE